ncbi:MAG TPA: hypothetical protein VN637_00575 [Roseiarcus sp.]|jgi:hypothetical protein|nr:hypothetical protein [Roseiarcus sp.]
MTHPYAAIDPLALIFPTRVYLILVEKLHPNTPLIDVMRAAAKTMTAEEKAQTAASAKRIAEFAHAAASVVG